MTVFGRTLGRFLTPYAQQLINHSEDLLKLRNEGLNIEVSDGYLIVHNIPYVDQKGAIKEGKIVSELTLAGNITSRPKTHVVYFVGEIPCDKQGVSIKEIYNSSPNKKLTHNISGNHLLSNKPPEGYSNYYDKIMQYIRIITAPAKSLDSHVTEKQFNVVCTDDKTAVFNYIDSNSSRAGIRQISQKLENQRVAIIGLGGTGSYLLDFVAKTPVKEISIFDGDQFLQHNAFRSPGAPSIETLTRKEFKTDYLYNIYSKMHKHIIPYHDNIKEDNVIQLTDMDMVFICIDKSSIKKIIIDFLTKQGIAFIDVGMGIDVIDNKLSGIIRVTSSTAEKRDHIVKRISFDEGPQDDYASNIQIAELNALNATLAIIKWKKMLGFYQEFEKTYHSTFTIDTGVMTNEEN